MLEEKSFFKLTIFLHKDEKYLKIITLTKVHRFSQYVKFFLLSDNIKSW